MNAAIRRASLALVGLMTATTAPVADETTTDAGAFEAVTIQRSGSLYVALPPDDALPLFTALGETRWIPTWQPTVLHGDGYEPGTVWVTVHEGRKTVWYVAGYDTDARTATYVRTTNDVDTGTVNVKVTANDAGGSTVRVTYQLTALSTDGNRRLRTHFDAETYAAMLATWQRMIADSIGNAGKSDR
ncbi:MAG: SRPBCC family protein [Pseudomonadota bacterium]